jgi:hypothetical protein
MDENIFKINDKVTWYGNIYTPKIGIDMVIIRERFKELRKNPDFNNVKKVHKLMDNFRKEVYNIKYKVGVSTISKIKRNYLGFKDMTCFHLKNNIDVIFVDGTMSGVKIKPYIKRIKEK